MIPDIDLPLNDFYTAISSVWDTFTTGMGDYLPIFMAAILFSLVVWFLWSRIADQ